MQKLTDAQRVELYVLAQVIGNSPASQRGTARHDLIAYVESLMQQGWQDIASAPITPFDSEKWYMPASPRLLLWVGKWSATGKYSYTKHGKGRWRDWTGTVTPTHWMPEPLPPPPASERSEG